MFKVSVDERVEKILYSFSKAERAKIDKVVELFKDEGFALSETYLKKLSKTIWELRPGRIRLLFGVVGNKAVIVNVFVKKTEKTPPKEIRLAERRLAEHL